MDDKLIMDIWPDRQNKSDIFAKISKNEDVFWTKWHSPGSLERISAAPWLDYVIESSIDIKDLKDFRFLPPCQGTKVVGLAHNYRSLVGKDKAYQKPLIFIKTSNSITGHYNDIEYPEDSTRTWLEVELGIVISKKAKRVPVELAAQYIAGYTIVNDITTENIYDRDHHLGYSKSQDFFCPIGPWLVTDICTDNLRIRSFVDNIKMQDGSTRDRILNDFESVSYISKYLTLDAGDVITTGTCAGWEHANISPGSIMTLEIEHIGKLKNKVI